MSILKIARMGHPVLRRVAEPLPVVRIGTPEIQRLIDDMLETLVESDGAGLAAPQVHRSVRIVVVAHEESEPLVFINPEISFLSNRMVRSFEGCLSIPDIRGAVARMAELRVEAFDRHAKRFVLEVEGFAAIALQHECDHLDGTLFLDHCDTRTLAFMDELRRFGPLDPSFRRGPGNISEEGEE